MGKTQMKVHLFENSLASWIWNVLVTVWQLQMRRCLSFCHLIKLSWWWHYYNYYYAVPSMPKFRGWHTWETFIQVLYMKLAWSNIKHSCLLLLQLHCWELFYGSAVSYPSDNKPVNKQKLFCSDCIISSSRIHCVLVWRNYFLHGLL